MATKEQCVSQSKLDDFPRSEECYCVASTGAVTVTADFPSMRGRANVEEERLHQPCTGEIASFGIQGATHLLV